MDAKRLEEFRKKLRKGSSVRVVNGEIIPVDAPDSTEAAPRRGRQTGHRPKARGVQVKPHEWGTSFLTSDAGQRRALKEQALLLQEYPSFEMDVDDDGTLYVHGWVGPNRNIQGRYHVLVLIPPGYGSGVMPSAHVLEPGLQNGAPHTFVDGSLCLDHSGAFTAKSTLVTFMAWVCVWLALYEGWLATGERW